MPSVTGSSSKLAKNPHFTHLTSVRQFSMSVIACGFFQCHMPWNRNLSIWRAKRSWIVSQMA